ncbi:hypothetical protein [Streptomyces lushanensis]|uniref:hypothetical protein n=1 Tax=Streptomyces lushanensis TaxID=1434255 RepID=UPI00114CE357|nr:hypothetical protein [Streptomyces lushanensis]
MRDLPQRTTATLETADVLRSLTAWAQKAEPHMDELVVTDHSRSHTVRVIVTNDHAAQSLMEDLVPDTGSLWHRPGRCYRALLPTGHSLSVNVVSIP